MASKPAFSTEFKVEKSEILMVAPSDVLVVHEDNPRGEVVTPESVEDLYLDLKANGQVQAVVLRKMPDRTLRVIAGVRRVVAGQRLQAEEPEFRLRAEVVTVNDEEAFVLGIRENAMRKDVNPINNALAMRRLIERYGWATDRVAELYRVKAGWVEVQLKILGLPSAVRSRIASGALSLHQAKELVRLSDEDAVAVVEQAELDVATDPAAKPGKPVKINAAVTTALRDKGVRRARTTADLLKLVAGRLDPVSVALVAYLKGEADESPLFEALDAAEPAACGSAEYIDDRPETPAPVEAPKAKPARAGKARKAKPEPKPVAPVLYSEADDADEQAGVEATEPSEVDESEPAYA